MGDKPETVPTWGYSENGDKIFHLAPGAALPEGYVDHPAKVKGSAAEKQYRDDAKREGASTAFIDGPASGAPGRGKKTAPTSDASDDPAKA